MIGALVFGVGLALLAQSPFRMPIGERLFRLVWIGPLGRSFTRIAGRKVARGRSSSSASHASVVAAPRAIVSVPSAVPSNRSDGARVVQLEQIEQRISALEQWRRAKDAGAV